MPKFTRRTVVLGVLETTPGTDPGAGYAAILTNEGAEINPEAEFTQRNTVRATFSPTGGVVGQKRWTINLPVELKGGGSNAGAIVAPELDWALQSCAMKKEDGRVVEVDTVTGTFEPGEAINLTTGGTLVGTLVDAVISAAAGTLIIRDDQGTALVDGDGLTGASSGATASINLTMDEALIYRPITTRTDQKSATIRFSKDGIRHVATNVRGNMSLDINVGSFGVCTFNLQGVYSDPTDTANPSATYSTITPPVAVNAGLAIGGWDMSTTAATQMQIDLANTVTVRNDFNSADGVAGIEITGRGTNGSINPEVAALSDHNPWTLWKNGTTQKIYATLGSSAGERIRLLVPKAQYQNFSYQDRDGIAAYQFPFLCQGDNEAAGGTGGDDEFYMIFY